MPQGYSEPRVFFRVRTTGQADAQLLIPIGRVSYILDEGEGIATVYHGKDNKDTGVVDLVEWRAGQELPWQS